ncbi:MAG: SH3 domain-containing protein [Cyanobacteria bacterium J06592_8]
MKNKSILITTLCTVLIGGVSSMILPPLAIAQTGQESILIAAVGDRGVLTAQDPTARINLRTEPSMRSRVRGYGVVGDRIEVLQERRTDGERWVEVKILNSGDIGWVPGNNVRIGGQGSIEDQIRLSQSGDGVFSLAGRRDSGITQVTVTVDTRNQAVVALRLRDNRFIRFSGDLERRDADELVINVKGSGDASASGRINIEYGRNNSINTLFGDGRLDGQRFSINFEGDRRGSGNNPAQEFVGQDVNEVVRTLRSRGWKVVETDPGVVKLDKGRQGMDIEFNPRTRRVRSVRMVDI